MEPTSDEEISHRAMERITDKEIAHRAVKSTDEEIQNKGRKSTRK